MKPVLSVLVLSGCLVAGEVLLRQVYPVDTGTSVRFRIPDPKLGWVLEPGASYWYVLPEANVQVRYNSEGWRDVDHSRQKPSGVVRVLVLGDSFMEGYSVGLDESFHREIETRARSQGMKLEVINMGVGGYGTLQELLVFLEKGRAYTPDIVLLGFLPKNDLRNNSLELESILKAGSMKTESRPFLDPQDVDAWTITRLDYGGNLRRYHKAKKKEERFWWRFRRRSVLLQRADVVVDELETLLSPNDESDQDRNLAMFGSLYCEEPPEITRAWATTKRILERLDSEVSKSGAELAVFSVPALVDVSVEKAEEARRLIGDSATLCIDEGVSYQRLGGVLEGLDIPYIDLTAEFQRVGRGNPESLFRISDAHWGPGGHALAAGLVLDFAISRGMLVPADAPGLSGVTERL